VHLAPGVPNRLMRLTCDHSGVCIKSVAKHLLRESAHDTLLGLQTRRCGVVERSVRARNVMLRLPDRAVQEARAHDWGAVLLRIGVAVQILPDRSEANSALNSPGAAVSNLPRIVDAEAPEVADMNSSAPASEMGMRYDCRPPHPRAGDIRCNFGSLLHTESDLKLLLGKVPNFSAL
jgi:hypothetical protein